MFRNLIARLIVRHFEKNPDLYHWLIGTKHDDWDISVVRNTYKNGGTVMVNRDEYNRLFLDREEEDE